jgi:hypothetical protein
LQDPAFFLFLLRIDEEFANQTRAAGCACGEVLHSQRVGAPLPGTTLRLDKVQTQQMKDGKQVPLYTRVDLHMLEE